jgi:GNS1/SUR4 family
MDLDKTMTRGLFFDFADPRTRDRPFMGSPWPLIVYTISYVALVAFLRHWMKRRKPYRFRKFSLALYSFYFVSNVFIFVNVWPYWITKYTLGCEVLDTSNSADALQVMSQYK